MTKLIEEIKRCDEGIELLLRIRFHLREKPEDMPAWKICLHLEHILEAELNLKTTLLDITPAEVK